jgi:hypothetical protein
MPIVVSLDINRHHNNYYHYFQLPALEKIRLIKERITAICEQLKDNETYKNKKWIVAWREHGISESKSKEISNHTKRIFKDVMSSLTQTYPNLTIIGGTVKTRKTTSLIKSKDILSYYDQLKYTDEEEKKFPNNSAQRQIQLHKKHTEQLVSKIPSIDLATKIDVIRNTCYIFEGKTIKRHDKMAPFKEINFQNEFEIFKPGGKIGKNISHLVTLKDPSNDQDFNIAIEICREHLHSLVKKYQEKSKINPLLHFVMSDHIPIAYHKLNTNYIIYLDSLEKQRLILMENIPESKQEVVFLMNDLLSEYNDIILVKACYPFILNLIKQIDTALADPSLPPTHISFLNGFKKDILQKENPEKSFLLNERKCSFLTADSHYVLKKKIENLERCFKINPEISTLSNPYQNGQWTRSLLTLLEKCFNEETFNYYSQPFIVLKHAVLDELKNYSTLSMKYSASPETDLMREKILLIQNLNRDIYAVEDFPTLKYLLSSYKIIANLYEEDHSLFFKRKKLEDCITNIENSIIVPYEKNHLHTVNKKLKQF